MVAELTYLSDMFSCLKDLPAAERPQRRGLRAAGGGQRAPPTRGVRDSALLLILGACR